MAYYFNSISTVSILTNLMIAPLVGIVLILSFTVAIIGFININLAQIFSYSLYILNSFIIYISNFFSTLPYSTIMVTTPNIVSIFLYYLIILNFFFNKKFNFLARNIFKSLIFLAITVLLILKFYPKNYIEIRMVDVGQGDCIYIETQNRKSILIDGGGTENNNYDIGKNILLPYLLDRGKKEIDLIILSHAHEDHIEGLFTVLEKLKVKSILVGKQPIETELYRNFLELAKSKKVNIKEIIEGDKFIIDGIIFETIYPGNKIDIREDLNNNSLVLKMSYKNISALFTGDIEKFAEEIIKVNISANILKAAHHGSKTSSTKKFIEKVNPNICIIGVGKNNLFGHPDNETIDRIQSLNCKIYRTDLDGEIYIKIYTNGKIITKTSLNN